MSLLMLSNVGHDGGDDYSPCSAGVCIDHGKLRSSSIWHNSLVEEVPEYVAKGAFSEKVGDLIIETYDTCDAIKFHNRTIIDRVLSQDGHIINKMKLHTTRLLEMYDSNPQCIADMPDLEEIKDELEELKGRWSDPDLDARSLRWLIVDKYKLISELLDEALVHPVIVSEFVTPVYNRVSSIASKVARFGMFCERMMTILLVLFVIAFLLVVFDLILLAIKLVK